MGRPNFWQLIFADDLEWVVQGLDMFYDLVLSIFAQIVMGVPYSWKKFGGGELRKCPGFLYFVFA